MTLVDLKDDTSESDYVLYEIRDAGYFCIRHKHSAESTGSRCVRTRFFNHIYIYIYIYMCLVLTLLSVTFMFCFHMLDM